MPYATALRQIGDNSTMAITRYALVLIVAGTSLAIAAESKLGKPLTLDHASSIQQILQNPTEYTGKTVQVKGKITEVCQMMGCWMALVDQADSTKSIRIQVKDGDIVFPKDAPGKIAVAEGTLIKQELSREQVIAKAKHEAGEQGRKFDPSKIKQGSTYYEIQGTGAVIND